MVVYVIDDWEIFKDSVATCRYKLYRVKELGRNIKL